MNKLFTLILFCLCAITNNYAQQNIVKLNVLALGLGNISIQDEYSINGKLSAALGLSYLPTRGIPSYITSLDSSGNAANLLLGGFSVTPELRYYFKGNGPKGFYLAAYLRYSKYKTNDFPFTYNLNNGGSNKVVLNGDYKTTVFGLMLGSQKLLGNKWALDLWIFGVGFGSQKGEFAATGKFSESDQQDIKDEVASVDIPYVKVNVTTSASLVTLAIEPKFPAMRGIGLCLGYRF